MAKALEDSSQIFSLKKFEDWVRLAGHLVKQLPCHPSERIPVFGFYELQHMIRIWLQSLVKINLCVVDANNRVGSILYYMDNLVPEKNNSKLGSYSNQSFVTETDGDYPFFENNKGLGLLNEKFRCTMVVPSVKDEVYFDYCQPILSALSLKLQRDSTSADVMDLTSMCRSILNQYKNSTTTLYGKHIPSERKLEGDWKTRKVAIQTEPSELRGLCLKVILAQENVGFMNDFWATADCKKKTREEIVTEIQSVYGKGKSGYSVDRYNFNTFGRLRPIVVLAHFLTHFVYDDKSVMLLDNLLAAKQAALTIRRHHWGNRKSPMTNRSTVSGDPCMKIPSHTSNVNRSYDLCVSLT